MGIEDTLKVKLSYVAMLPEWVTDETELAIYDHPDGGGSSIILADPLHPAVVLNYETGEWELLSDTPRF